MFACYTCVIIEGIREITGFEYCCTYDLANSLPCQYGVA